jgi:hypothetical protein
MIEVSQTIKHMIEEDCVDDGNGIPVSNATSKILTKVIDTFEATYEFHFRRS